MKGDYCCKMRERFVLGIVAENATVPMSVDVVDYQDFENLATDGRPFLKILFCPFCGRRISGGPLRLV